MMYVPDTAASPAGNFTALGLNPKGDVTWKYALPFGHAAGGRADRRRPALAGHGAAMAPARQRRIDPRAGGRRHAHRPLQLWQQVNGLATVEIDGKPVLLISSANGVEALGVVVK